MELSLFFTCLTLGAICVGGWYWFKKHEPSSYGKPVAPTEGNVTPRTLSLYGDSISWAGGLAVTPAQSLGAIATVTNYAAAGMRLHDFFGTVEYHALLQPDLVLQPFAIQISTVDKSAVVFMRLGINDALQGFDVKDFADQLRAVVTTTRQQGKVPVLGGLTHFQNLGLSPAEDKMVELRQLFNDAIQGVAGELGVHFIDIGSVSYDPSEVPDGLHPNQEYSSRIDAFILQYFNDHKIFA